VRLWKKALIYLEGRRRANPVKLRKCNKKKEIHHVFKGGVEGKKPLKEWLIIRQNKRDK